MTLDVSIIVPCRNEATHIGKFMESALGQDLQGIDWELIVAVAPSTDGTREALEAAIRGQERISIIDNPEGIVSTGLNAAIAASRGRYVVRMDVHTEYARDYVKQCLAVSQETGADNVGGPWRAKGEGWIGNAIAAAFQSPLCAGGALAHNCDYEGWVDTVYLGCWKREVFDRIGAFDPALVRNQDDEFNLRLSRAGGRIWQSPRVRSWYRSRPTLRALFRQYLQYGFWKPAVIRKHGRPASVRHLAPGAFILGNVAAAVLAAVAALAGRTDFALLLLTFWALGAVIYLAACLAASMSVAAKTSWAILPILPVVFATYHAAYGAGFLAGLAQWSIAPALRGSKFFSAITR
jgi:glycosyltransferase involved in cell wall biosynthesis